MMETVIKIDDKLYDLIKHYEMSIEINEEENDSLEITLMRAVLNGTILPKGHGRLIDADELKRHKYHDNNRFENEVAVAQVDWAETIIEADKGE